MPNLVTFTLPPKVKPPKESWWTNKSRADFYQTAAKEAERMRDSAVLTPTAKDTMTTLEGYHNKNRMRRAEDGGRLV